MSSALEGIMANVTETAKSKASPAVLLNGQHLVGFSANQSATKKELDQLLGRRVDISGMSYYVSHVSDPGQYAKRGFYVRFSKMSPDTVSIDRCKQGTCTH